MNFLFKDVVEATAQALALQNDRLHYVNDLVSEANAMTTVVNLMGLKDYYMAIMRWMVVDQLIKGYYTPADERLRCICQCEIEECDKALADCTHKAIADEIRSEIFKILSH